MTKLNEEKNRRLSIELFMRKKLFRNTRMTSTHKTIVFVSLFVALAMNANRLISTLHPEIEVIIDVPWVFNLFEFLYQVVFSWIYFFALGVLLLGLGGFDKSVNRNERLQKSALIFIFFSFSLLFGLLSQKYLFNNLMNSSIYRTAFIFRFVIGSGLIYVMVRVIRISKDRKAKELENEQLKSAYSDAQLKNLRAQINPHFLFNAFTNLSGLMAEDVKLAQKYVGNLSKVFRYSLAENASPLVELTKELESLRAQIELLKIRYQHNLNISIDIEKPDLYKIPVMSLQPLLDNVTKHNIISKVNPGYINVNVQNDKLYFSSAITVQKLDAPSNGIGLYNLNERFKLLLDKEIDIDKTENDFIVVLPLMKKEN